MSDISEEMSRKLINAFTSGLMDIGEIIKWRAQVAQSNSERAELEALGYEVQNGVAKATVLQTNEIPPEALEGFAKRNDFKIYNLDTLEQGYNGYIIPEDKLDDLLEYIEEYKALMDELNKEEEYEERTYSKEEREETVPDEDTEKNTDDIPDENETVPEIEEEIDEDLTKEAELEKKKEQKKREQKAKSSQGSHTQDASSYNSEQSRQDNYTQSQPDIPAQPYNSSNDYSQSSYNDNQYSQNSYYQKQSSNTNSYYETQNYEQKQYEQPQTTDSYYKSGTQNDNYNTYEQSNTSDSYYQSEAQNNNYNTYKQSGVTGSYYKSEGQNANRNTYRQPNVSDSYYQSETQNTGFNTYKQDSFHNNSSKSSNEPKSQPASTQNYSNSGKSTLYKEPTKQGVKSAAVFTSNSQPQREPITSQNTHTYESETNSNIPSVSASVPGGTTQPQRTMGSAPLAKTTTVYNISTVTSTAPNLSANHLNKSVGSMITSPLNELRKTETGRELHKVKPIYELMKGASNLGTADFLKSNLYNNVNSTFKKGGYDELDSFLRKNGCSGLNMSSDKDLRESLDVIFGGQGKAGFFRQNKINLTTMSEDQITLIFKEHFGCNDALARSITKQAKKLNDELNRIKTVHQRALSGIATAGKSMFRQAFADDEGMQTLMSSVDMVSSAYHLLQTAGEFPPSMSFDKWKQTVHNGYKKGKETIHEIGEKTYDFLNRKVFDPFNRKVIDPLKQRDKRTIDRAKDTDLYKNTVLPSKRWVANKSNDVKRFTTGIKDNTTNFINAKINWFASKRDNVKRFTAGVKKGTSRFVNSKVASFRASSTGRFFSKGAKVIKQTGRYVFKGAQTVKRIGGFIAKPFNILEKGLDFVTNKFKKFLLDLADAKKHLMKVLGIILGWAFVLELIIAGLVIIVTIATSVIVGFFEYDDGESQKTIMEYVYKELIEEEKDWMEDLIGNGQNTNLYSYSHPVSVNDQSYTLAEYDLEEYCGSTSSLTYYDGGVKGPKPFDGNVPLEAYKSIKEIDGGNEVTFNNGHSALLRTSNIKDIISMSTVFYSQDFEALNNSESFVGKIISGIGSAINALNNLYKNLASRWNKLVAHVPFLKMRTTTIVDGAEIVLQSTITKIYCSTLFQASHRTAFELKKQLLPISTAELEETADRWLNRCPESEHGGCKTYDKFYYLDDGAGISADNAVPAGSNVTSLDDDCSLLATDDEKEASPCWEKQVSTITTGGTNTSSESLAYSSDTASESTTTTVTYVHKCNGEHSGVYCGGHLKLISNGYVYTMTDLQLDGKCVGKVPNNNKIPETDETTIDEEKIKQLQLNGTADIFDIDSAIHHLTTRKNWKGWTKGNMEWAVNLYNQDWYELYELKIASRVEGGYNGGSYTQQEIEEILKNLQETDYSNLPEINKRVLTEAYSWIGLVGYDQNHHCDPLAVGSLSDCSGFVSHVLMNAGINIGVQTSASFYSMPGRTSISTSIVPGDILVRNGHVMIFAGLTEDGKFICLECNSFGGKYGPGITRRRESSLDSLAASGYMVVPLSTL